VNKINGLRIVTGGSLVIAILQSICTAVLTISGIRLAIGLTAFVMAGSLVGPVRWFHQDAIRIPMLLIATIGAVVDLGILWWMRRLRTQPAAQWRRRELSNKEKRSHRLQFALALLTLVLVGTETWTHAILHRHRVRAHSPQATATVTSGATKDI
jgi:ABC-type xylose transport system permease subunit